MRRGLAVLVGAAVVIAAICGGVGKAETDTPSRVLIVEDELPQMEFLARYLKETGELDVSIVEQNALPEDLSPYRNVIVFIHGKLEESTERAVIDYTEAGGKAICLHHSISSKKALNEFWFEFLGMELAKGAMDEGGYKYIAGPWTLVNLNSRHFITNHRVQWDDAVGYRSSDSPSSPRECPSMDFGDDSEVFVNHNFIDGRDKTVLCGLIYTDKVTGKVYMQDRGAWYKPYGKGVVFYFMPGHGVSDYRNENVSRIILNAIQWQYQPTDWPSTTSR